MYVTCVTSQLFSLTWWISTWKPFFWTQVPPLSVTPSLLIARLVWCDPGIWRFMQPLLALSAVVSLTAMLLTLEQYKSRVVNQNKKNPCGWCRMKTKATLLISEQNKNRIVDARTKQKPCSWCRYKDIPSEMEVASRYKLLTLLTLFICTIETALPC